MIKTLLRLYLDKITPIVVERCANFVQLEIGREEDLIHALTIYFDHNGVQHAFLNGELIPAYDFLNDLVDEEIQQLKEEYNNEYGKANAECNKYHERTL